MAAGLVMEPLMGLWRELTQAVRRLWLTPVFSLIVILVLAVPAGVATAVSAVARAVLADALPYGDAERLLKVSTFIPQFNTTVAFTPALAAWRERSRTLEGIAGYQDWHNATMSSPGEPMRVQVAHVTSNLLQVLRVPPSLGRDFTDVDERPGAAPAALVSHALWRERLGARPDAIGSPITLSGVAYEVRGVLSPGFQLPGAPDTSVLIPLRDAFDVGAAAARPQTVVLVARTRTGSTPDRIRAELGELVEQATLPPRVANVFAGLRVETTSLRDDLVASIRLPLLFLLASAALVLLLGVANLVGLHIVRAQMRRREMAVRLALGASSRGILRQLSVENLLLATCSGVIALLVAAGLLRALPALSSLSMFRVQDTALDGRMILCTFAVVSLIGQGIAFAAAAPLVRERLSLLSEANVTGWGRRARALRTVLVIGQVAVAFASMIAAGLLLRSFANVTAVPLGFDPEHVLTASISGPGDEETGSRHQLRQVLDRMLDRIAGVPGVEAVGFTSALPPTGNISQTRVVFEDATALPSAAPTVEMVSVSRDFMKAMRIRLQYGRYFTDRDTVEGEPVLIVNDSFRQQFFPGRNPVGARVRLGSPTEPWASIVGVVADVRQGGPEGRAPAMIYLPYAQQPTQDVTLAVRTTTDADRMGRTIRAALQAASREYAAYDIASLEQRLASSNATRSVVTRAMIVFALLSVALSIAGVFGLTTALVAQRLRELAIRAVLGASPALLGRHVLRWAGVVLLTGLALGGLIFVWSSRLLANLLFGVTVSDVTTVVSAGLLIAAAVLMASAVPAFKAARVDLTAMLRHE